MLARRKEENKRKHERECQEGVAQEVRRRKKREQGSRLSVEVGAGENVATDGAALVAENGREGKYNDNNAAGGKKNKKKSGGNRKRRNTDDTEANAGQERLGKEGEGRRREHAARETSAQQKKDEIARKRAQRNERNAAGKRKKTTKDVSRRIETLLCEVKGWVGGY